MSEGLISSRSDYAVGQTIDISYHLSATPFGNDELKAFTDAYKTKKSDESKADNWGKCEMYCTLVQKESDRTKALGVDGSLDFSYGPVSGDANVKFAMNNIQGSLQLTVVVRGKQEGRIIKNDLNELINLTLRDAVTKKIETGNYTIEQFKKDYGSYLIYGFDYGGEINFTSTYSSNSSQDKMSVGGALSLSYKEMGFNIKGSVDGNYSSNDISKSTNIETKYTILPSFDNPLINGDDGIIELLDKISDPTSNAVDKDAGDAGNENKEDTVIDSTDSIQQLSAKLYAKMQKLLGGKTEYLDPVKAIIYPIESIPCVADAFTNIKPPKVKKFFKAMNPLYQTLKEILKGVITINKNYNNVDNKPTDLINKYLKALEINIKKMEIIDGDDIDKYADVWYNYTMGKNADGTVDNTIIDGDESKDEEEEKEAKYEVEKNFYKIDKNVLESEFNRDLFNPYNDMMKDDQNKKFDTNNRYQISLKANNGKYASADVEGMYCKSDEIQDKSEIFISVPQGNDKIALYLAADFTIISVNKQGEVTTVSNDGKVKDWEKFKIIDCNNGKFGLQSYYDTYLSARSNYLLQCDQTELNESEQFEIKIVE